MKIPLPTYQHQEPETSDPDTAVRYDHVRRFLNCPNWKCDKCGTVMMGRMTFCVYCKLRLGVDTPRPITYELQEKD